MKQLIGYRKFVSINESKNYGSLRNVEKEWNGGYVLYVDDYLTNGTKPSKGDILIAKNTGKAIALTYLKSDGSEGKYLWVPNFGVYYDKNSKGGISKVKISPYKNWLSQSGTEEKIIDFLDSFEESLEFERGEKERIISLQAQNDLDLILDLYGINSPIKSFSKGDSENEWEANLENGFLVSIKKRSSEDMVGEFTIYPEKNSDVPVITISNSSNDKGFRFRRKGDSWIIRNVEMTDLKKDPVANYLFKNIAGLQEYEDEKSLLSYYESLLKSYDPSYQRSDDFRSYRGGSRQSEEINLVSSLLEDFLTRKKIEEIYNKNRKS